MGTKKITCAIFKVDPKNLTVINCSMLRKTEKMESTNHEDFQINQIEMGEKIDLSKVTTFPIVIDDVYYFNSEEKAIAFIHSMLSI